MVGVPRLEKFLHTGKTLRNIGAFGNSPHVECAHGELCPRFSNGLRRNNANRRPNLNSTIASKIPPIALDANPPLEITRHHRTNICGVDIQALHHLDDARINFLVVQGNHCSIWSDEVFRESATEDPVLEILPNELRILACYFVRCDGTAVLITDENVLHRIYKPTREIPGLRSLQGRIGLPLPSPARGNEELQNREPLVEIALNGELDRTTGRIGHKPLHSAKLRNLPPASARSGIDDVGNIVLLLHLECLDHRVREYILRFSPNANRVTIAFISRNESLPEIVIHQPDFLIRFGEHRLTFLRQHNIRH